MCKSRESTLKLLTFVAATACAWPARAALSVARADDTGDVGGDTGKGTGPIVDLGIYQADPSDRPYGIVKERLPPPPPLSDAGTSDSSAAPATGQTWTRAFRSSDQFGNSNFAAGYEASLDLASRWAAPGTADALSANGKLRVMATAFGKDVEVVRTSGFATIGDAKNAAGVGAVLTVLGSDVWSARDVAQLSASKNWDMTFFQADMVFAVIIPIHVRASVGGSVGLSASGRAAAEAIAMTFRPTASLNGSVAAAVDCGIAAIGIQGDVKLVTVALPISGALSVTDSLHWTADVDLVLTALSGKVDLFASALFATKKLTIFTWPAAAQVTLPIAHLGT